MAVDFSATAPPSESLTIFGKSAEPVPYARSAARIVSKYAIPAVASSSFPAFLPTSLIAGVTSPTIISGMTNPRNYGEGKEPSDQRRDELGPRELRRDLGGEVAHRDKQPHHDEVERDEFAHCRGDYAGRTADGAGNLLAEQGNDDDIDRVTASNRGRKPELWADTKEVGKERGNDGDDNAAPHAAEHGGDSEYEIHTGAGDELIAQRAGYCLKRDEQRDEDRG